MIKLTIEGATFEVNTIAEAVGIYRTLETERKELIKHRYETAMLKLQANSLYGKFGGLSL